MMKLFYECSFFDEDWNEETSFVVNQQELKIKNVILSNKVKFQKISVDYKCSWDKSNEFDSAKPSILIPIKDNSDLLKITVKNLLDNGVSELSNVIIIDDRSSENLREHVPPSFSYLRIDNDKGFNFSMLNNIAAKICHKLGCREIVLWNSDLWVPDKHAFPTLLKKHRQSNSLISGSKLLYPPKEMSLNGELDTENIKSISKTMLDGKWRGTVQFGGDRWVRIPSGPIHTSPVHYKRFANKNNPFVNCDKPCFFVTGAFQIWDLNFFIDLGGLNPSLAKNFQDVDICLRAAKKDLPPMYFGKDVFLYHDESANLNSSPGEIKKDVQFFSDHHLFGKIWKDLDELLWN